MKMNKIAAVFGSAALILGLTACGQQEAASEAAEEQTASVSDTEEVTEEAVQEENNREAIIGSWKVGRILAAENEGEEPTEETAAKHDNLDALFNESYTFNEDGTGVMTLTEDGTATDFPVTWRTEEDGSYTVTDVEDMTYIYDPADDTLIWEYTTVRTGLRVVMIWERQ